MVIILIIILGLIACLIDYFDCKDRFIVATIRAISLFLIVLLSFCIFSIEVYAYALETKLYIAVNK